MDGTALNSRLEMTPRNQKAIHEALATGAQVAFCTGRSLAEMEEYLPLFPEMRWLIAESGAAVLDLKTREEVASFPIEAEAVERLLEMLEGREALTMLFIKGQPWMEARGLERLEDFGLGRFRDLYQRTTKQVEDLAEAFRPHRRQVRKINLYFQDPRDREFFWEVLSQGPFSVTTSIAGNIELSAPNVDKGVGLRALCDHLGLPLAQAVAVGDSSNDAGMLRVAGIPVAMANATPEILALAKVTVADCEHDGVAQALETFWLQPGSPCPGA